MMLQREQQFGSYVITAKWFEKLPDSIGGLRWKPKDIGRKYVPFYSDSRTNKKGGKK